ncbi:putative metal-dependent hydrolase [Paraburkholderia sp. GAS334]
MTVAFAREGRGVMFAPTVLAAQLKREHKLIAIGQRLTPCMLRSNRYNTDNHSTETPPVMQNLKYLSAYPTTLQDKVRRLIAEQQLGAYLEDRYPRKHAVQTDRALYDYCADLKREFIRNGPQIDKVIYDSKLDVLRHALGLHTTISRVQGSKLKTKKEIRIASLFRDTAPEFLRMIVVHELAHLKESDHNKAFYRLCEFMQPGYHQTEFDLRLYLTHRDLTRAQSD